MPIPSDGACNRCSKTLLICAYLDSIWTSKFLNEARSSICQVIERTSILTIHVPKTQITELLDW